MDLLQNRRFLSCKMSYHIRRTTCARLARRFPLHNKFINPHLLCLGFLFQLSLLKHQSERYHEKDARTPYRPDSELRHGKRTKSSTECEQRDDAKVTFRSEPRPPTAAGQGTGSVGGDPCSVKKCCGIVANKKRKTTLSERAFKQKATLV